MNTLSRSEWVCGGVALAMLAFLGMQSFGAGPTSTIQYAKAAVTQCASESDHAACYESVIPALYPKLSVAQLFEVVREVRREDTSYQFCHVLAHKIGERVVAEDPSKWVDAIPLNPADGICSNGFVHGVVGGRFRAEVLSTSSITQLLPDFKRACEPRTGYAPSDLDRSICYHGMGHLFDFITNADIPVALGLCTKTTPEDYRRMCIEGVFMQINQPLEPDDFELIKQMAVKPTEDTVRSYCATFKDPLYVGACLRESWPYFTAGIKNGTEVAEFCSGQPDALRTTNCYESMSSIVGRMTLSDIHQADAACKNFPAKWRQMCYNYSAEAVLEEDRNDASKAIALCGLAGGDMTTQCQQLLVDHSRFLFGQNTAQRDAFCAALPQDLRAACMRPYTNPTNS